MSARTDLALECLDSDTKEIKGVKITTEREEGHTVDRVEITDKQAEVRLGKPCGSYVTVNLPSFIFTAGSDHKAINIIAKEIDRLLPESRETVLVAGLGNTEITPDALGPKAASRILATRHISGEVASSIGLVGIKSVAAVATGVLGKTGMETEEIIGGICDKIRPDAVIVIDALAAREISHLGRTVQICNTGICPGSGVRNKRKEISNRTLGIPVIAVGVPTVTDAGDDLITTHRDIDMLIDRAAEVIALSVNLSLQPALDIDTLEGLI